MHTDLFLETEMAKYQIDKLGILFIEPKKVDLTDEIVEYNYNAVKSFLNGKKRKMFVDNTHSMPFDKKHRMAFEQQSDEFCLALAFTSKSVLGNAVANIFIAMTRTKIPMKIFKDKDVAMRWLIKQ